MIRQSVCATLLATTFAAPAAAQSQAVEQTEQRDIYAAAALGFEDLVNDWYAYPERLPGGSFRLTQRLQAEAEAVDSKASLLRFAERALFLLADHHAITNSSFSNSWAIVPSYADLWIEKRGVDYVVTAVREESPAARAGIEAGSILAAVDGTDTAGAVSAFWRDLGASGDRMRDGFAARVLAAGRRDRERSLDIRDPRGRVTRFTLPNLYEAPSDAPPPVASSKDGDGVTISINDALGRSETIAAFDEAMTSIDPDAPVVLDLTNTPGGGNTSIARAIMGWFVESPHPYQWHELPDEERRTGISRQWIELVAPREGKHHPGGVTVKVGRWTGSMGEGLAVGFDALGYCVYGTKMAGLLGAIDDFSLGETDLAVKLPYERLRAVDGTPREDFEPSRICD